MTATPAIVYPVILEVGYGDGDCLRAIFTTRELAETYAGRESAADGIRCRVEDGFLLLDHFYAGPARVGPAARRWRRR